MKVPIRTWPEFFRHPLVVLFITIDVILLIVCIWSLYENGI